MPSVFQFMVSKSQTVELQEVDVDFMKRVFFSGSRRAVMSRFNHQSW